LILSASKKSADHETLFAPQLNCGAAGGGATAARTFVI
jgi:hypothetical protein